MVRKGILLAAVVLLLYASGAPAELRTMGQITILTAAMRMTDLFQLTNSGEARITFQAEESREVKGLVELDAVVTPGTVPEAVFDVPRAYLKIRFPSFRLTAGKTRLSWGSGFIFDAGDVIFGGMSAILDLTQVDPRDRTAWLASAYVPLGDFSFLEGAVLPHMPLPPGVPATAGSPFVPFESLVGGARAVLGLSGFSAEAGYLYDGDDSLHKPFVSVQGSLFFDLYAAAGISIPQAASSWDDVKDSLTISFGASRIFGLEAGENLSFRAEAGFIPYGQWKDSGSGLPPGSPGYGALVFLESVYSPSDAFAVQARGILSPVDASGVALLTVSWNIYQGLRISATGSLMFGHEADLFGWGRDGDVALLAGLEYRF